MSDDDDESLGKKVLFGLGYMGVLVGGGLCTSTALGWAGLGDDAASSIGGFAGLVLAIGFIWMSNRRDLRNAQREYDELKEYFESRLREVERVAASAGPLRPGKETSFNRNLVRKVLSELNDKAAALDQPLPSGTKVDTWFEYAEMDWFITVKENLGNQQRLTIQGEVEDIILHARPEGIAWIVVAVVTDPETNINTVGQLHRLRRYLERRERQLEHLRQVDAEDSDADAPLVEGMFFLRCLELPVREASA